MEFLYPVFRMLLLGSLVRVTLEIEKPTVCVALYAAGTFAIGLAVAQSVASLTIFTIITTLLAWGLLALLFRMRELSFWWWLCAIFGTPIAAMVWVVVPA